MSQPNDFQSVDALFLPYMSDLAPGISAFVVSDGVLVHQRTTGLADVENQIPCRMNTMYRLASLSKSFTAMAVLILIEQGVLHYDTAITSILRGFPPYGSTITIKHLLTHTSGVIDYEDTAQPTTSPQLTDYDVLLFLQKQSRTYFASGSHYRYSNSGYALLAMCVEAVADCSLAAFLEQHIFLPLQMTHTCAGVPAGTLAPYRAYGYTWKNERYVQTDQNETSSIVGDGGIYASAEDMYRWDQALRGDTFVSQATRNDAFQPHAYLENGKTGYGYGWYIGTHRSVRVLWHGGSTIGFRNIILRFPDQQGCVTILTNRAGDIPRELAYTLADRYIL